MNLNELQTQLSTASSLRIVGSGSCLNFLPKWSGELLNVSSLTGVISIEPDDLVFEAWAGTPVGEVQDELAKHGLALPLARDTSLPDIVKGGRGSIGGLLAMDLPHALTSQCGGPREWTLGMTIFRADGTTAKCGSKVVKNVAGYDVHKLFVGSRGTVGVIAKVTMRAYSNKRVPAHEVDVLDACSEPSYIARTLRSDFDDCVASTENIVAIDRTSCTVWSLSRPNRIGVGWVIGPDGFRGGGTHAGPLENSALAQFDPDSKFAPGWSI